MATTTLFTRKILLRSQCHCRSSLKVLSSLNNGLVSSIRENSTASSPDSSVSKLGNSSKAITISRAMRAYIESARAHDEMMKGEIADYEIGKRHLANIMGEDPDSFSQEDVDRAIEYLLPSSLFDKRARPMMKHPLDVFPKKKAAQFGEDGRPFHWMYFTTYPNYYNLIYDINWKMENLKVKEDELYDQRDKPSEEKQESLRQFLSRSEWMSFAKFQNRMVENIKKEEYDHFVVLMDRLVTHPLAYIEEDFIMTFRDLFEAQSLTLDLPSIEVDSDGRAFTMAEGKKKHVSARVYLTKPGTGKVSINGQDLSFFTSNLHRESLMFPLALTGLIGDVDLEAEVITEAGGPTSYCAAMRFALSKCVAAFVDDDMREQMRLSGMLTQDPRTKERKKPGQEKARKKFTWKKR